MCLLPVSAADVVAAVIGVWDRLGAGYVAGDGGRLPGGVSRFPSRVGDLLAFDFL
jgi:hypothetical protein